MQIITQALPSDTQPVSIVRIPVERLTLAKRRWRGIAEDGQEFGFDLNAPLEDGALVFENESFGYAIAQKFEPVLELRIAADAARVGWMIGNLHFQIEVLEDVIRVVDDPAVRQMFEREGIGFVACKRVFHPITGGHHH